MITETVMEGGITISPPSSAINETFLEDQIVNSSSSVNATDAVILPAYIAYTNFVLFRFYKLVLRGCFTLFFFSLVLAVGVIGNVLVLIVILTSKSM